MSTIDPEALALITSAIEKADGLIIGAGAGMGVDSGLPDFRGQQGFWRAYPALAEAVMDFTEIANPEAFRSRPRLAWGFYGHRFNLYRKTASHDGYQILKRIGEKLANQYQVFTSNVDGHFQSAGFAKDRVYECHGSINYWQCSRPCCDDIWSANKMLIETDDIRCQAIGQLPVCEYCGEIARPNILMFGDFGWNSQRSDRQAAMLRKNISLMQNPVVIECGAGTAIPTVRYFCEKQRGLLVRINPRDEQIGNCQGISLRCGALEALQLIEQVLQSNGFYD
ncbi:SIR2 family NAD-dependent protein deacylase [Aliikangiella coralliicola]|uniref:protein acetyllysine N-acetyltransferase n=1 Tax=Aliikangiella coralliicola TaxID=2592383 RepID=A0A545UBN1_9GAMM|nr:Sir2 family NAD-dependent protein deacetylase [Aliikangiella coralliicola]TQV86874.1 NAD-dependent deacetylase [Aliikangiella coralliicola]